MRPLLLAAPSDQIEMDSGRPGSLRAKVMGRQTIVTLDKEPQCLDMITHAQSLGRSAARLWAGFDAGRKWHGAKLGGGGGGGEKGKFCRAPKLTAPAGEGASMWQRLNQAHALAPGRFDILRLLTCLLTPDRWLSVKLALARRGVISFGRRPVAGARLFTCGRQD